MKLSNKLHSDPFLEGGATGVKVEREGGGATTLRPVAPPSTLDAKVCWKKPTSDLAIQDCISVTSESSVLILTPSRNLLLAPRNNTLKKHT